MDEAWFKRAQKKAGVTAEDIAAQLGRDRSIVSKIYAGKARMSLEWAQAFATALDVPLATVLEKAGVTSADTARQVTPGFAESDAAPFHFPDRPDDPVKTIARALGAARPGVDVWRVKGSAMALCGLLDGDFFLLDTHAAERCTAGDIVIAQIYQRDRTTTVMRRFEPPVLVAASCNPTEGRVHVVDGVNVVVRGKVVASWRT